ncbi:MAG: OFA family MFS transporter [Desulfovibrionaceae bacterium]
MPEDSPFGRWKVVLGAVLVQLCLGSIYAWSVFTPTLEKAGWEKVQTQVVFSVSLAAFAVAMVWAGKNLARLGPRKLCMAGGVVLGAGYVLAGLFAGTSFVGLIICLGVIGGAGIGLGYVAPIAVGMRWFPDKKGMITGLAVAGFGFGAMGWVKLAGSWGNLLESFGLSATFIVYGLAFAGLVLLGGIWMVFPPEGWLPPSAQPQAAAPAADKTAQQAKEQAELAGTAILKTYQFYMIFITFAISASAGLMSIGLMKLYPMEALQAAGLDAASASAAAGTAMAVFFSLANGVGRIAWGMISDLIGRKRSILLMTTTQGFILIMFTAMAGNELALYLGSALIGFNFGGNFALFPTITADVFGAKNVGQNYPLIFLSYGVGGIAGPIMGGVLGDLGNFPLAFTICGTACIVSATFTSLVRPINNGNNGG